MLSCSLTVRWGAAGGALLAPVVQWGLVVLLELGQEAAGSSASNMLPRQHWGLLLLLLLLYLESDDSLNTSLAISEL